MAEHLFNAAPVILIVDDQPSDVLMLSEAVRDLGEVHVASDGRMALEVARFCRPDLVLLDIQMPQITGFEMLGMLGHGELGGAADLAAHGAQHPGEGAGAEQGVGTSPGGTP